MSKKLQDEAIAKYLAYCHTTPQQKKDFKVLLEQAKKENRLYLEAVKEAYELKLLSKKKLESVLKMLDDAHEEFKAQARQMVEEFDELYAKTNAEWQKLGPNYRKDDLEYNTQEFRRFCSAFAAKYGEWFLDARLRHDPLDDMNWGTISIRELQTYESSNWYPNMQDWMDLPFGARMLRIHLCWWDLTLAILHHEMGYETKPTKDLRSMIKETEK